MGQQNYCIPAHQSRVMEEKRELDEKIAKLKIFLVDTTFLSLPAAEQLRMKKQHGYMSAYSRVLGERIAEF